MNMKKENQEKMQEKISEMKEQIEELKEDIKECEKEKSSSLEELEEYKKKAEDYYDQLIRLKAEFENYRKRVDKEKKELIEWARYDTVLSLMPLFEMMKMAQSHISSATSDLENLKMGLTMIFNEFEKIFKNMGLREIEVLGKMYDPMTCEIVATVDGNEEDNGKVIEVIQAGYKLNDKVIKPAKVKIIKRASQEDAQNKSE